MDLRISDTEIEEIFAPAIRRETQPNDPEWVKATTRSAKKERPSFLKSLRNLLSPRSEKTVDGIYSERWSTQDVLARLDPTDGKSAPLVWRDRNFLAYGRGTKRVQLLYLMRIIEHLKPKSVLEIGSGMGQNLVMLSGVFPDTRFSGLELTKEGVEVAESLISLPSIPDELIRYAPVPIKDTQAHKTIRVTQGSAAKTPFENGKFDLVYSIVAIEQMNAIKHDVFAEIRRVCTGHAVMIEAFADWNKTPLRAERISGRQQFNSTIASLADHGLNPIFSTDNMPTKFNYGVGVVVSKVDYQASDKPAAG